MDTTTIYLIILCIGAIQGVVMGVILWRSPAEHRIRNRFLASILFFFAYRLCAETLTVSGILSQQSFLYHIVLEYNWVYGALIFFYIRSCLNSDFRLSKQDRWHFLPVMLEFVFSNWVKIQNLFWDGSRESLSVLGQWSYVLWMHTPFQLVVSCGLILWYVRKSKQTIEAQFSQEKETPKQMVWLVRILMVYQWFSWLVIGVSVSEYLWDANHFAFQPWYRIPTYVGMSILTYWLGLEGFGWRNLAIASPTSSKEFQGTPQQRKELDEILDKLNNTMQEQQLYKQATLKVADLAEAIHVQPYLLTQALNGLLNKSFSDYVNEYRVAEVKRMLKDPAFDHYSLISIGYEAGFNSKSSFNRIVKKLTGKSPRELKLDDSERA